VLVPQHTCLGANIDNDATIANSLGGKPVRLVCTPHARPPEASMNIVRLPIKSTTPPTSRANHADALLLEIVARWRLAREQARVDWATLDLETINGTQPETPASDEARDAFGAHMNCMEQYEAHLRTWKPRTTRGAYKLLEAALDMIASAEQSPDHVLGRGPVKEILRNVMETLETSDRALTKRRR
jgi:hypothetical protein